MRRAAAGRSQTCIRRARGLRSIAAEKELLHLPLQLRKGSLERFPSRIDDDGPLWIQAVELMPDCLAESPANAVAHHGFADGAG